MTDPHREITNFNILDFSLSLNTSIIQGMKVLLVEDDLKILKALLKKIRGAF